MRDLSDIFISEDKSHEFTHAEEEMILPISIEDSVILRFEHKLNNFDFESERRKASEIAVGRLTPDEFDYDYDSLKRKCAAAAPSRSLKFWVISLAVLEIAVASMFLLIIWIVLILDLVILAAEVYFLKKLKRFIWEWKNNKVDRAWSRKIEAILEEINKKYIYHDLEWKFDPEGKWLQFSARKKSGPALFATHPNS